MIMNSLRDGLLEEIIFWRNMLLDSDLPQESPEYQKIQGALELVQMRLKVFPEIMGSDNEQIVAATHH